MAYPVTSKYTEESIRRTRIEPGLNICMQYGTDIEVEKEETAVQQAQGSKIKKTREHIV